MAFEVTPNNRTNGLEADTAKTQGTLQFLASLSTPTTELVMRTAMELGQSAPYSDAGWLAFMTQLANLTLVDSALTAQERSVINEIRSVVTPEPSLQCGGFEPVVSALTSMGFFPFVGDVVTYKHQIEVKLALDVDETIKSVDVTLVGVPAAIPVTFKCTFDKCTGAGRLFTYIWLEFGANPSGNAYTIFLDFKDADDNTITSFTPSYSPFVFP